MPWWGWVILGAALFGAELTTDASFYLAFLGASALVVALLLGLGVRMMAWDQLMSFGVISAVTLVVFRRRVYEAIAPRSRPNMRLVGETAIAQGRIAPGAAGRVELRGTGWTALNVGAADLETGARVRVERVDGLVLHVRED